MSDTVLSTPAVVVNLRAIGLMSPAHVRQDVVTVEPLGEGGLIFWSESGWVDRYVRAIWDLMPDADIPGEPDWTHSFVPGNSAGLSIDTRVWQPVDSADYRLLHGGKKGVCDERWYLAQDLRHRASGTLVRAIAAHYAPKRGGLGRPLQRTGNRVLAGEIKHTLHRNVPVLLGADFNQTGKPLGATIDGRPIRQTSGDHLGGIDKLLAVAPAGYDWILPRADRRVVGLRSDHDAVATRAHLVRAA